MSDVLLEDDWEDYPVRILTLNRPDRYNAINDEMMNALGAAVDRAVQDGSSRLIVLTGAGKAFSSGADLDEAFPEQTAAEAEQRMADFQDKTVRRIHECDLPVIAMVNGSAVGAGMGLVLAADLIVASEEAVFQAPFTRIGLVPDTGLALTLIQSAGLHRAREILLTGGEYSAREAHDQGWVNRLAEPDNLSDETENLIEDLLRAAPLALSSTRALIRAGLEPSMNDFLVEEALRQGILLTTEDLEEARRAFRENRDPQFQGQ